MLALATAFTRGWVGLYTIGLPKVSAQARRAEIDSDLWEQMSWMGAGTVSLVRFTLPLSAWQVSRPLHGA